MRRSATRRSSGWLLPVLAGAGVALGAVVALSLLPQGKRMRGGLAAALYRVKERVVQGAVGTLARSESGSIGNIGQDEHNGHSRNTGDRG